jgi:phospholipid/cholesterol/gamma-HCH transport system ATP-binding protein
MIELIDIKKTFEDKEVLRGVSMELRDGETLVVLGRSGCGKSVTLKIILRLMRPDAGRVLVDGADTTRYSEDRMMPVRKRMGMLFQGSALFDSLTVRENVAYALREHTGMDEAQIEGKVAECLEFVEMNGTQHLMPAELSGGMKKRVALARAIALGPAYMFYDEPTTGLDPLTSKKINQLIRRLKEERGVSSIVVTHEIANAFQVADRFVVMKDGLILASGTAEEIRRSDIKFVQDFIKGGTIADGKN